MKCPECDQPAVTFSAWTRGATAFKTRCQACGAELVGNAVTIIGFVGTLALALGAVVMAETVLGGLGRGGTKLLVILPAVLLGGVLTFFLGGYRAKH